MQTMIRTERELPLTERQHDLIEHDDTSMGELVSQLAHEGKELAVVELRRLRVEMREQAGRAAKAAAAGYLAVEFIALATLALSVGVFLLLRNGRLRAAYGRPHCCPCCSLVHCST